MTVPLQPLKFNIDKASAHIDGFSSTSYVSQLHVKLLILAVASNLGRSLFAALICLYLIRGMVATP